MAPNKANMTIRPLTEQEISDEVDRNNELDASTNGEQNLDENAERGFIDPDGEGGTGDGEPARGQPVRMSPQDAKREAMINRFRRADVDVFDGDLTRPENMYGRVAQEELEPDPEADEPGVARGSQQEQEPAVPDPAAQPAKRKLVVRGQEVYLTDDEILARAQTVTAADSYLAEAKALLQEAKQIRGERAAPSQQHPAGERGEQDDGRDSDPSSQAQHPAPDEDDLASVVEQIQFGDPKDAARLLRQAISKTAQAESTVNHVNRLVKNDLALSQKNLADFRTANPELDKDKVANVAIESLIYDIYRDEIKALGVDESQIPKDQKTLADWHRLYRVHGHNVSKTADVLEKAKAGYLSWRGDASGREPQAKPRKEATVRVDVNRTERRMNIPLQPTRSVTPRPDPAKPTSIDDQRRNAVQEMRKSRGQLTG